MPATPHLAVLLQAFPDQSRPRARSCLDKDRRSFEGLEKSRLRYPCSSCAAMIRVRPCVSRRRCSSNEAGRTESGLGVDGADDPAVPRCEPGGHRENRQAIAGLGEGQAATGAAVLRTGSGMSVSGLAGSLFGAPQGKERRRRCSFDAGPGRNFGIRNRHAGVKGLCLTRACRKERRYRKHGEKQDNMRKPSRRRNSGPWLLRVFHSPNHPMSKHSSKDFIEPKLRQPP